MQITPGSFVPHSKGKMSPTFLNLTPTSPGASAVFSLSGNTLTVKSPSNYGGAFQITFQLADPKHVFIGIAVKSKTAPAPGSQPVVSAGRQEFRTVIINRDTTSSQMVITDAFTHSNSFDYDLLIQATSLATNYPGQIGIIDPGIDNETDN